MRLPFIGTWEEVHSGAHRVERNKRRGLFRKYALSDSAQDRADLVAEGVILDILLTTGKVQVSTRDSATITSPDLGAPLAPFDPQKALEALRSAATATDWTAVISTTLVASRHTLLPKIVAARVEHLVSDEQVREYLTPLLPKPLVHGDRTLTTLATFEPSPDDFVADDEGTVRVVDWDSPVIGPLDVSLISLSAALTAQGRDSEAQALLEGVEDAELIPWVTRCRLVLLAARAWAAGKTDEHEALLALMEEGKGMGESK